MNDDQAMVWMFGERRRMLVITAVLAVAGALMGLFEGAPVGFVATVVALYLVIQGIIGEHLGRGLRREAAEREAAAAEPDAEGAPDVHVLRVPLDEPAPERVSSSATPR